MFQFINKKNNKKKLRNSTIFLRKKFLFLWSKYLFKALYREHKYLRKLRIFYVKHGNCSVFLYFPLIQGIAQFDQFRPIVDLLSGRHSDTASCLN